MTPADIGADEHAAMLQARMMEAMIAGAAAPVKQADA